MVGIRPSMFRLFDHFPLKLFTTIHLAVRKKSALKTLILGKERNFALSQGHPREPRLDDHQSNSGRSASRIEVFPKLGGYALEFLSTTIHLAVREKGALKNAPQGGRKIEFSSGDALSETPRGTSS